MHSDIRRMKYEHLGMLHCQAYRSQGCPIVLSSEIIVEEPAWRRRLRIEDTPDPIRYVH